MSLQDCIWFGNSTLDVSTDKVFIVHTIFNVFKVGRHLDNTAVQWGGSVRVGVSGGLGRVDVPSCTLVARIPIRTNNIIW